MKHVLRTLLRKRRDFLSKAEIKSRSSAIQKKLFSLPEFKKAENVLFYASIGSEVDTFGMMKTALKDMKAKKIIVPVVKGDKIVLSSINSVYELKPRGRFKIPEPAKIKKFDKRKVDLVLVPGIAFSTDGHRIGYGKGHYDKLLKGMKIAKIGLCYELQLMDKLPNHKHDVKMDLIVSEKRVIKRI